MNKGEENSAAFLLHQSVERYYHAVLLVYTGYKPKLHNIEELADMSAPFHEALVGALPRSEPEDHRLFDLLKRAYIDARYSTSYRITYEELTVLRGHVLDLAGRVRVSCRAFLETIVSPEAVSELPEVPQPLNLEGLPEPPLTDDAEAMDKWRDLIVALSEARGRKEGHQEGLREGEEKGHQEGLREGEAKERQRLVTQLFEAKFGPLSAETLAKLQKGTPEELDTWAKRLLTAASLDEVFPS
jgi:HEPN domain-containing protein